MRFGTRGTIPGRGRFAQSVISLQADAKTIRSTQTMAHSAQSAGRRPNVADDDLGMRHGRRIATLHNQAHEELLAIHEAVMNPMEVTLNEKDTFTVKMVKEFILRAVKPHRSSQDWVEPFDLMLPNKRPPFPEWCECPPDKRSRRVPYLGVPRCTVCGGKCP